MKIISFGSQQMIQRILSHSKKSSLYAIWSSVALLLGREHVEFSAELKGLFPYYVISYNKQGSFQMITKDYSKGPRVVRKDYVL